MKNYLKLLFWILFVLFVLACGSGKGTRQEASPELKPDAYPFKRDGIRLIFTADPKLNFSDGMAHTLHICFYQLSDPNAFHQLAGDTDGLYQLLDCFLFDTSVTGFKALTVQPGQTLSLPIDRAEGSRYVGIATGYSKIEKERIIRFVEIPVNIKRKGLFWKDKYAVLADLNLKITLGPQQIDKIEVME